MTVQRATFPHLRCPQCGYEYRPTTHGWAFKTGRDTICDPQSPRPSFSHPFEVVEGDVRRDLVGPPDG